MEIAKDAGAYVISDEVYKHIIYGGLKHYSPMQFDENLENTILIDRFSKYYAVTGWRLGYVITPKHLRVVATGFKPDNCIPLLFHPSGRHRGFEKRYGCCKEDDGAIRDEERSLLKRFPR